MIDLKLIQKSHTRFPGVKLRYILQDFRNLFADANEILAVPRAHGEADGESYIPLAPTTTSTTSLTYRSKKSLIAARVTVT